MIGARFGLAAGDAGAGYEFTTPPPGAEILMKGGDPGREFGEWTGDTPMAICAAGSAATRGLDAMAVAGRFPSSRHFAGAIGRCAEVGPDASGSG